MGISDLLLSVCIEKAAGYEFQILSLCNDMSVLNPPPMSVAAFSGQKILV